MSSKITQTTQLEWMAELIAVLGVGRAQLAIEPVFADFIRVIQEKLALIERQLLIQISENSVLAEALNKEDVRFLERVCEQMQAEMQPNRGFIPGKTLSGAQIYQATSVAKKVLHDLLVLSEQRFVCGYIKQYLQRITILLPVFARYIDEIVVKNSHYSSVQDGFPLDLVNQLMTNCVDKARQLQANIVVAILDNGANLVGLNRMEQAFIGSINAAQNKAYTSALFRMPTAEVSALSKAIQQPLCEVDHINRERIIQFAGGYPLYLNQRFIGAVGISGATTEQDSLIALAAVTFLEREMI